MVRGLVANLSLTLPAVLVVAAITIVSNAARSSLYVANLFGFRVDDGQALGWFAKLELNLLSSSLASPSLLPRC